VATTLFLRPGRRCGKWPLSPYRDVTLASNPHRDLRHPWLVAVRTHPAASDSATTFVLRDPLHRHARPWPPRTKQSLTTNGGASTKRSRSRHRSRLSFPKMPLAFQRTTPHLAKTGKQLLEWQGSPGDHPFRDAFDQSRAWTDFTDRGSDLADGSIRHGICHWRL
jgi:hypothetical protein